MTAPARLFALSVVFLLVLAPAASAATTAVFDDPSNRVTLTNDGTAATFAVVIDNEASPVTYTVTATGDTIDLPAPAGSNCTVTEAGTKLSCTNDNVSEIVINGGAGADVFSIADTDYYGGSPGLVLNGDAGDDTFTAAADSRLNSRVKGGADNDTFNGSPDQSDDFYAEPGNDTYNGGTRAVAPGFEPETYQAIYAQDRYYPITEDGPFRRRRVDVPVSLSLDGQANDADGMSGTDNLTDDIETLFGTASADTLAGGAHSVILFGQDGDDTITGSAAADNLYGNRGSDTLRGGGGADELYDGDFDAPYRLESDPTIPSGNDRLDGGDGEDQLVWGAGADDVAGGGGIDTGLFARVETQVIGPADEPPAVKWAALSLSLDDVANDGAAGEGDNLHSDVENIDTTSTEYDVLDRRSATVRSLRLDSSDQSASRSFDTITGSAAVNVITTGKGNDSVDAKGGADTVDVGDGDDQVNAVDQVTDVIRCGRGADNAGVDLPGTNPGRADSLTDCENVSGTALGLEGGVLPTLPAVPKLTLGGSSTVKSKTFLKKYTVGVGVTTDQPATVVGELTTTQAKIAKVGALSVGSGKLASGAGQRTLKLKVAKKYRSKLKRKLRTKKQRRKGIKLSAVITVTNAAGQSATSRRTIKIKG